LDSYLTIFENVRIKISKHIDLYIYTQQPPFTAQIEGHSAEEQIPSKNGSSSSNHSKPPPPIRVATNGNDPVKPIAKPPKPSHQSQQHSNPPSTPTASLSASEKLLKFDDDNDEDFTAFTSSSPPRQNITHHNNPTPSAANLSFNAFDDAPQQSSAAPIISGALLEDDLLGMDSTTTVKPTSFNQHVYTAIIILFVVTSMCGSVLISITASTIFTVVFRL